jgi:hypothetical protein
LTKVWFSEILALLTNTKELLMDADRFFHEVDREAAELDHVNGELRMLANELIDEQIEEEYRQFIQDMLGTIYEELDVGCEFDRV